MLNDFRRPLYLRTYCHTHVTSDSKGYYKSKHHQNHLRIPFGTPNTSMLAVAIHFSRGRLLASLFVQNQLFSCRKRVTPNLFSLGRTKDTPEQQMKETQLYEVTEYNNKFKYCGCGMGYSRVHSTMNFFFHRFGIYSKKNQILKQMAKYKSMRILVEQA